MGGRFTELRSELMQLEADASAIRLDYEMDPGSLVRRTTHFARRTRLPLTVSKSLVLQALGLEGLDRDDVVPMYETASD